MGHLPLNATLLGMLIEGCLRALHGWRSGMYVSVVYQMQEQRESQERP